QNLVGFAQLAVLALQGLDAVALFGRLAGALSSVGLLATNPAMQRLRDTANLRSNGLNGRPLGWIVVQVFQNHAHSTFTNFRGVGRGLIHSLIFSRVEASTKPGAIQASISFSLTSGWIRSLWWKPRLGSAPLPCARWFFPRLRGGCRRDDSSHLP